MTQGGSAATNPGNFANRPKEEVVRPLSLPSTSPPSLTLTQQAIASKGGKASGHVQANADDAEFVVEEETGTDAKGTYNPGNFANRPKEEVVSRPFLAMI